MANQNPSPFDSQGEARFAQQREHMVRMQLEARDIVSTKVLDAMRATPRHLFIPPEEAWQAYEDHPVRIGADQTISQPYIVALMTQLMDPGPGKKILEIGLGSGYQAAVLAAAGADVYSIEIVESLARQAAERLRMLGYETIHVRIGDGRLGWPEEAPFDGILAAAAPQQIPSSLMDQLKVGGRMAIPVGGDSQSLLLITRTESGFVEENVLPVRFVPMTGRKPEDE